MSHFPSTFKKLSKYLNFKQVFSFATQSRRSCSFFYKLTTNTVSSTCPIMLILLPSIMNPVRNWACDNVDCDILSDDCYSSFDWPFVNSLMNLQYCQRITHLGADWHSWPEALGETTDRMLALLWTFMWRLRPLADWQTLKQCEYEMFSSWDLMRGMGGTTRVVGFLSCHFMCLTRPAFYSRVRSHLTDPHISAIGFW